MTDKSTSVHICYTRDQLFQIRETLPPSAAAEHIARRASAPYSISFDSMDRETWAGGSKRKGPTDRRVVSSGSLDNFRAGVAAQQPTPPSISGPGYSSHSFDNSFGSSGHQPPDLWIYRSVGQTGMESAAMVWPEIQALLDSDVIESSDIEVRRDGETEFMPFSTAVAVRSQRLAPQPLSVDDVPRLMDDPPIAIGPMISDSRPPAWSPLRAPPPNPALLTVGESPKTGGGPMAPAPLLPSPVDREPPPPRNRGGNRSKPLTVPVRPVEPVELLPSHHAPPPPPPQQQQQQPAPALTSSPVLAHQRHSPKKAPLPSGHFVVTEGPAISAPISAAIARPTTINLLDIIAEQQANPPTPPSKPQPRKAWSLPAAAEVKAKPLIDLQHLVDEERRIAKEEANAKRAEASRRPSDKESEMQRARTDTMLPASEFPSLDEVVASGHAQSKRQEKAQRQANQMPRNNSEPFWHPESANIPSLESVSSDKDKTGHGKKNEPKMQARGSGGSGQLGGKDGGGRRGGGGKKERNKPGGH